MSKIEQIKEMKKEIYRLDPNLKLSWQFPDENLSYNLIELDMIIDSLQDILLELRKKRVYKKNWTLEQEVNFMKLVDKEYFKAYNKTYFCEFTVYSII